MKFPQGEDPDDFRERSIGAFLRLFQEYGDSPQLLLVVHGGTIMSLMSGLAEPSAGYFENCVDNGHGFVCEAAGDGRMKLVRQI